MNDSKKPTVSAFYQLHRRKRSAVFHKPNCAKTLMVLSADDHKAIANLLQQWLSGSSG